MGLILFIPNMVLANSISNIDMNIYVDNSLSGGKFINFEGNNLRRAIALEPQNFLLNEDEIVLTKDKVFKNYIEYKFKKVN